MTGLYFFSSLIIYMFLSGCEWSWHYDMISFFLGVKPIPTYPRTYDLIHSDGVFSLYQGK
jgi:Putative S-adenosyl-L-methionine-dependent methyltransferase